MSTPPTTPDRPTFLEWLEDLAYRIHNYFDPPPNVPAERVEEFFASTRKDRLGDDA